MAELDCNELDFPGSRSIAIVTREVEYKKTGKRTAEEVPYISNLVDPTCSGMLTIIRRHWGVESLFHVRDATLNEDRHTMHTGNGALNFALLRNFAISVTHLTNAPSFPDAAARFRQNPNQFLAHFKTYQLALAA